VGKPEGERILERHIPEWEDIKTDLKEIKWEDIDWINQPRNCGK
jgi:hypothetical protein